MANTKVNTYPIVILFFIVCLIGFGIYKTFRMYVQNKELKHQVSDIRTKIVEDSIMLKDLQMVNDNCSEQSLDKTRYYEKKIKSLYIAIDATKSDYQDLQGKKDAIDTIKFKKNDIIDYINQNF